MSNEDEDDIDGMEGTEGMDDSGWRRRCRLWL